MFLSTEEKKKILTDLIGLNVQYEDIEKKIKVLERNYTLYSNNVDEHTQHIGDLMSLIKKIGSDLDLQFKTTEQLITKIDNIEARLNSEIGNLSNRITNVENTDTVPLRKGESVRFTNQNGTEPWAEILADGVDEKTSQLKMSIDWNKSFIQNLINHGFRGKNDEEIISQWLMSLYHNFSNMTGDQKNG